MSTRCTRSNSLNTLHKADMSLSFRCMPDKLTPCDVCSSTHGGADEIFTLIVTEKTRRGELLNERLRSSKHDIKNKMKRRCWSTDLCVDSASMTFKQVRQELSVNRARNKTPEWLRFLAYRPISDKYFEIFETKKDCCIVKLRAAQNSCMVR